MFETTNTADSATARKTVRFVVKRGWLRRQIDAAQQSVPCLKAKHGLRTAPVNVDAVPHFRWRAAVKALMRSDAVIPESELDQRQVQRFAVRNGPVIQFSFQGAEEPLDAAVLPGAVQFGDLMFDAEQFQAEPEKTRREHGFVVSTDDFRPAVADTGLADGDQQGQRSLVRQRNEIQIEPRAVIDDAEDWILITADDCLSGQIDAPGAVLRSGFSLATANPATHIRDFVSVTFDELGNIRLANRHVAARGVHPIENVRYIPTAQLWLHGFQSDDLLRHPVRLATGAVTAWLSGRFRPPATA